MNPKKEALYAEIMYQFRYFYKTAYAPPTIFKGKSRLWVSAFNDLVAEGFIKKHKKFPGYEYKWVAAYPKHF